MVASAAMQGLGKPGSNIWGTGQGAPVDTELLFPGYAEGGISGDVGATADDAEMVEMAAAEGLEVLQPELSAKPRVYYKNLHLWTKAVIAGTVVFGDTDECAEGVTVTVSQDGQMIGGAITSNYGDFHVDRLERGGEYTVVVGAAGYAPFRQTVELDQGLTVGTVVLAKD
jgi:hypothetical protein